MMATRRFWDIFGFAIIATSLHVSAAAIMLPDTSLRSTPGNELQAALAAGSPEIAALVAAWDAAPEPQTRIAATATPPATDDLVPLPAQPHLSARPHDAPSPLPAEPSIPAARPNLPEPPLATAAPPQLPPLRTLPPRRIEAQAEPALTSSARPQARPDRPKPARVAQPAAQPQPKQQPQTRTPRRQSAVAASKAGGTGGGRTGSPSAAGGESAANLLAGWQRQISACLSRSISRVSGVSGSSTTLSLRIGRNGRIEAARLARSTGNARLDREIVTRALRARCPAAPAGLSAPSYPAQLPIGIR